MAKQSGQNHKVDIIVNSLGSKHKVFQKTEQLCCIVNVLMIGLSSF